MSLRDEAVAIVDSARACLGPDEFDMRRRSVVVRTTGGSVGGATGLAALKVGIEVSDLELDPRPRVRDATMIKWMREGVTEDGDLYIDRISATYTRAQLDPVVPEGSTGESYWLVDGDPYRLVLLEEQNLQWRATVRRMRRRVERG